MDKKKMLATLEDIQETLKYELKQEEFEKLPRYMQIEINEAIMELNIRVYAAVGYSTIHPKTK